MILIEGGRVFTGDGFQRQDVLIRDGVVVRVAPLIEQMATEKIDATGSLVGPGFVDMHTHLREPGQTWKEDISSGSAAAAAGGFTAVVAMPNTDPPIDDPKIVEEVVTRGTNAGMVEVAASAALTRSRQGVTTGDIETLYHAGVRVFTDDGDSVEDSVVLRDAMSRIATLPGAVAAQHAEDTSLTGGGHMHQGAVSARLGVGGLPAQAEERVVARDLSLVAETGAHYHCQHLSSAGTVDLVRRAKAEGLPVTAEVTPHHLSFDDSDLESLSPNLKMYPPLRSPRDRSALREALQDGTIDVVATDHAPHTPSEKDVSFEMAPRGVIGLETAASVTAETTEDPVLLFHVLSTRPARIAAMRRQGRPIAPGEPANLVVFDPNRSWVPFHFVSRSANSPYLGQRLRGRATVTIHEGRITHRLGVEA